MNWENRHYRLAVIGATVTLLVQVILVIAVDPYLASVLSPLYPVWVIIFVVGWRKEHPRR